MTIQTKLNGKKIRQSFQNNRYSPLKKFMDIIKGIDFTSFVIANIIVLFFFEIFLKGGQFWFYFLMFLVTLFIVKTEFVLSMLDFIFHQFSSQKSVIKNNSTDETSNFFLSRKLKIFAIVIITKQVFFNISYYLFPTFLIWLGLAGIFYVTGLQNYIPSAHFFELVTIVSIALVIFDYFLKRHEEKVAHKN